jgi:hypothetical protein
MLDMNYCHGIIDSGTSSLGFPLISMNYMIRLVGY